MGQLLSVAVARTRCPGEEYVNYFSPPDPSEVPWSRCRYGETKRGEVICAVSRDLLPPRDLSEFSSHASEGAPTARFPRPTTKCHRGLIERAHEPYPVTAYQLGALRA